ncbi:MAG: N-acetylmuramoyl-L-alanine amidase, partial [Bacteroidetes bacterium]
MEGVSQQKVRKVVIDAGHGGKDPGAVGKYSKEKDIALSIALKTGNYIQKNLPDVEVIYTRKTDIFVELHNRARIANDNEADLFISIHCNANNSSKP